MRILFITKRFSYLKNFEAPIQEFARRGHSVHLVALGGEGRLEGTPLVHRWAEADHRITYQRIPATVHDELKVGLRASISMMVDYLRYLDPAYAGADGLLLRARRRTSVGFVNLTQKRWFHLPRVRETALWMLRRLEAVAPPRPALDAFLRDMAPDVVLFTPLIGLQSEEQDVLGAAVERGLRTVFCVLSWDNLSSKALVRTMPDLVTVWNDVQRHEAARLHGVPPERIAVTGAQAFDHWFGRQPARNRAEFLARVGLPQDRPFLLWVCSSLFRTSPVEAGFVRQWIEAIRASADPGLRSASILIRPHPSRIAEWADVSLDDLGPVSLWGSSPIDAASRDDYFDSLYHSTAVVGLNTSAFLEAAIVGRAVYTVLLPQFHESQEGTLHFPYLLSPDDGLLHTARDMESHLGQLAEALSNPHKGAERSRRFVGTFIRPGGPAVSASTVFVRAIETLVSRPAQRSMPMRAGGVFSLLYSWLDRQPPAGRIRTWLTSPHELEHARVREAKLARAQQKALSKQQRLADKAARDGETTRRKPTQAKLSEHGVAR